MWQWYQPTSQGGVSQDEVAGALRGRFSQLNHNPKLHHPHCIRGSVHEMLQQRCLLSLKFTCRNLQ